MNRSAEPLAPYVPRISSEWDEVSPGTHWRTVEGSLLFVDISGFTNLSERLSRKGRIGAEELTGVLNRVFGQMLEAAFRRGGSLLKFGGDALLLFFDSEDHVMQACAAVVEMRAALRDAAKEPTSVGRIHLKMSSGVHTGTVDFFLVGDSHRELIVTGPTASITTEMEGTADAGEIVVSNAVREKLPADFTGNPKGDGWLLRKQKINHDAPGPIHRSAIGEAELSTFVPTALREYLGAGIGDSEHRIATVGFVKFKGVDTLLAEMGPKAVGKELDRLVRAIQRGADAEGITFLASDIDADGGKIILTAGVPASHHDDEGRMLRAARTLLDARCGLSVRMGVNRGHVFSGDVGSEHRRTYTVMGDTVNLAARLMAAAGPSMLYSSPAVLDRSTTLFETEALEPFYVKGKENPVLAYAVQEETGVRPPETKHELPFGGRDGELSLIVGIVTTCAITGSGGMLTITGDTGIGKTRLIAEVLDRCPDLDTLMVQAEPNGINVPYWAFRDPLRRMFEIEWGNQEDMAAAFTASVRDRAPALEWALPLLGDLMHIDIPDNEQTASLDPQFRPDRTADALIELLDATCPGAFAALAEDGHWMDPASIALLRKIGDAAERRPWTVIFTARPDDAFEPLGTEVKLNPLDDEAVRSITIEATEAAPLRPHELNAIVNRAGGNPLFLTEILQMIRTTGNADTLPESLDAVVSSEIDTLPPLTRQVLRYASVIGRSFSRVILNELLDGEDLEMDGATQKELGQFVEVDESDRMRFRHAVVHDAAYEGLSYRRRRELHARTGAVIEKLAGKNPDSAAESLASHYFLAGGYEKAWHYSRVAGDKARKTYANAEASVHYRHAIEVAPHVDIGDEERARVHALQGDVLDRLGSFQEALASYRKAQHDYPDPKQQAKTLSVQATMLHKMGELSRALGTLTRGLKLATANDATDTAVEILALRAQIRLRQGRHQDAFVLARKALDTAGEGVASGDVAWAEMTSDWAETALGHPTDYSATRRALRIAEEISDLHLQAAILNNLGMFAYHKGDWDEATGLYARSSEVFRQTGDDIAAAYGQANIAEILVEQGHLEEAETRLSSVLPVFRAASDLGMIADVLAREGRVDIRRGDIDSALEHFGDALEIYESMGATTEHIEVLLRQAEALIMVQRLDEAQSLLDRHGLHPEQTPPQLKSLAHRVHGLASWLSGKEDAGLTHLQAGLAVAREIGSELDEIAAGHALAATGATHQSSVDRTTELCGKLGIISLPDLPI